MNSMLQYHRHSKCYRFRRRCIKRISYYRVYNYDVQTSAESAYRPDLSTYRWGTSKVRSLERGLAEGHTRSDSNVHPFVSRVTRFGDRLARARAFSVPISPDSDRVSLSSRLSSPPPPHASYSSRARRSARADVSVEIIVLSRAS